MTNLNDASDIDAHTRLLRMAAAIGPVYETQDLALLLYSLIRVQKPDVVVELGTGMGLSALWMALAVRGNGRGHVYSVDSFELLQQGEQLATLTSILAHAGVAEIGAATPQAYFDEVRDVIGVADYLTIIERRIALDERRHFSGYPFAKMPIDVLFSDFLHGPDHIQCILGHFLPMMSANSSILIDSVGSVPSSYVALEKMVASLDQGDVPVGLRWYWDAECAERITRRRYRLLHLIGAGRRVPTSTAWLQMEPRAVGTDRGSPQRSCGAW